MVFLAPNHWIEFFTSNNDFFHSGPVHQLSFGPVTSCRDGCSQPTLFLAEIYVGSVGPDIGFSVRPLASEPKAKLDTRVIPYP